MNAQAIKELAEEYVAAHNQKYGMGRTVTRTELYAAIDALQAERDTLKKQVNSYGLLTKAQQERLGTYSRRNDEYLEATRTLQSERDANALLTTENEALRTQLEALQKEAQKCGNGAGCLYKDARIEQLEGAINKLDQCMDPTKAQELATEMFSLVGAKPCGCQLGTCESKVGVRCRMTDEIAATKGTET